MNDNKCCQNCAHKINMDGMLYYTQNEACVPRTAKCSWWAEGMEEDDK